MITIEELKELIDIYKRMGELLARVESVVKTCGNCGHSRERACMIYGDLPDDYTGPCDKWEWSDIPF